MKYELIGENNLDDIICQILKNRGVDDPQRYLSLDESCCNKYEDLDNIKEAVQCFERHFESHDDICVIVDPDVDGYTSAALLYKYIKNLDEDYPIHYIIHNNNKVHGLVKMDEGDFKLPKNIKLLIIPDAGTNDAEQCNKLIDAGIDIIILDHHDAEEIASKNKAIIVNNQMSEAYTDKSFSGVGIAYEFARALDDYFVNAMADDFLDLVAFGNISDVMSMKNYQTRFYVERGLSNIQNKFLQALDEAQQFSTNKIINIHNISWYWTPIVNAMIRIGSFEDREMLFRAFIETDEVFPYKKRGCNTEIDETIYDRMARISKNAKSRQDKMRDKLFQQLLNDVDNNDKIALVIADDADSGIVGLSAMKLADFLGKPCIVLKEHKRGVFGGSCRNFRNSPIKNFKELVSNTNLFNFAQGHNNAFGAEINGENMLNAKIALNKAVENIEYDETIYCDFILGVDELSFAFIKAIDDSSWLYGQDIWEPVIAIEDITISPKQCCIIGKNLDTVSFINGGVQYLKFKCGENDELLAFAGSDDEDAVMNITVIGKCGINTWGSSSTSQVIIDNYIKM